MMNVDAFRRFTVFLALLLGISATAARAEDNSPAVRLLVPAYFYPAAEGLASWKVLIESSARTPVTAIVNPDSGPGKRVDVNYSNVFKLAKDSKITLLGYVTLSYGKRPLSAVKADVDSWLHFYPEVGGIFFDEQPSQLDQLAFVSESCAYTRQRIERAVLVTNPGVPCAPEYLAGRDGPTTCLFEHETGFDAFRLPEWAERFDNERFAVLLYKIQTAEKMQKAFREAVLKRSGYLYITDAAGPNPWSRLPAYWTDEVQAAVETNSAKK